MNTRLTLSLDKTIIKQAKLYAKLNEVSLSKLIESYLATLTKNTKKETEITPLVKSLSGVIKLEDTTDIRNDYTDFLIEKYK